MTFFQTRTTPIGWFLTPSWLTAWVLKHLYWVYSLLPRGTTSQVVPCVWNARHRLVIFTTSRKKLWFLVPILWKGNRPTQAAIFLFFFIVSKILYSIKIKKSILKMWFLKDILFNLRLTCNYILKPSIVFHLLYL